MKVRVPKSFTQLPESEKQIINEIMTEEVRKQVNEHMAQLQKVWLQLACIVLHKNFGFGKKRALLFLANWREMYRLNGKFTSEEEQTEFLTAEIEKIFGEGGYPTEYIEKLKEIK